MKNLIVLAVLAFSTNAFAQKTLIFCDYNAANQAESVFVDLYFDYDAATGVYSNPEVGVLNAEQTGYPEYLWNVTVTYAAPATEATIAFTKDTDTMTFNFPVVDNAGAPNYIVSKADDKVVSFDLMIKGTHLGNPVDATFTCYDPSMLEVPADQQVVR